MPSITNKNRYSLLFFLAVLGPVIGVSACTGKADEAAAGHAFAPPAVEVMEVKPHEVPVVREYVGQTMGSREVEIHARVTGIIEKSLYVEGALVEAGAPLFQIDPRPFEVQVAAAQAELARARAEFSRAEREHARLEPLAKANAVSQKEIDDARSDVELAAAAVKLAEATLRDARIQLGYTTVNAPIGGVTGIAHKFEGALVKAGADSLLTTIVQTDPIDVHFSISENEWLARQSQTAAGKLLVPDESTLDVRIELADGTVLSRVGHINYSAARIDTATGTYSVRARFPNADGVLKAGQFVRVHVSGAVRPNAVAVPQKAVLQGPRGKFVFVVGKNDKGMPVAEFRPVEVGEWMSEANERMWIVRSGLAAGDRVILDNFVKLRPGAPIAFADPAAIEPAGVPADAVVAAVTQ